MTVTALTVQTAKGPFDAVTAGDLDFTFAAGATGDGNSYAITGKEILIAYNSDGANPYYITVSSVDDEKGRSTDITEYSLAAGDYAIITQGMTTSKGWIQTTGSINVVVENVAVQLAAIRLP